MRISKKKSGFFYLAAVFAVALFVYLSAAPSVSAAYAPSNGDVIKIDSSDRPAVYYIQNGKRYLFVNRVTYTTWASSIGDAGDSFYTLKKISQADFDKIPVGGNLTIKPGSKLIKFDDSNIIYAVGMGAKLYKLSDEAARVALYGNIAPVIIQSSFRANYYDNGNAVDVLTSASQKPDGIVGMADPVNQEQGLNLYSYRTDAYGFEVIHPNTWFTSQRGDKNGGYVDFRSSNSNGADTCLSLFGYPGLNLTQAEAVLPVLSVSGRKVDSRSTITINNIVWNKLLVGQQIVLLTHKNGNTYGAQYASADLDFDNCSQILSTYKITN